MFACSPDQFLVSHQPASISAHAFPTPSPSPPWDRGLNQHAYIAVTPPPQHPAATPTTLLTSSPSSVAMAQLVHNPTQVMILPGAPNPNAKDSRWLTLEVCREFQRSKCSRSDIECKFAHPPPHVEVQNGRVVACFDSLKGKCQRKDPPCKYLHPPQHLREQLLQNGRNNLILKNLQIQAYHQQAQYGVLPVAYETGSKTVALPTVMPGQYSYLTHYPGLQALSAVPAQAPSTYNPYLTSLASVAMPTSADATSIMSHPLQHNMITTKALRADKFETTSDSADTLTSHASLMDSLSYPTYVSQVCREFQRGTCSRATSECRYAHPADHIVVDATDNHVTVCMDFIKSKCTRDLCKYFHPPSHLQALVRTAHARNQAAATISNNSSANGSALVGCRRECAILGNPSPFVGCILPYSVGQLEELCPLKCLKYKNKYPFSK